MEQQTQGTSETTNTGSIVGINGNLIKVAFTQPVRQNEVGYAHIGDTSLKAEVIRIHAPHAELQVFEDTAGLKVGGQVTFTGELLSVELGPGLLSQVYDGLQNPLPQLAEACGFFLQRGTYLPALDREKEWEFHPTATEGDMLQAGDELGWIQEGLFKHRIMVPFDLKKPCRVSSVIAQGLVRVTDEVAVLEDHRKHPRSITLLQRWPVKIPIRAYEERLRPGKPMVTRVRIIDTFFPVARGGTYCIPGPFGAGKTVLQQITSRHAEVDIVILAACGERAGEVVETLREFPEIIDPKTGRSLMERTLIICNTSSMPVAAREASVYTGVTIAEYYRQMGLHVLLLADSTSRWAQALREVSGRLEEIPGDEAFPAYLESVIASFYERSGRVILRDGTEASLTIGGTVSPAGGNFEEPVTQSTLKVVGSFHGLSRERSDARRYPAIDPLMSWSKYASVVSNEEVASARALLQAGQEVHQMMMVVGEEGTSLDDFLLYVKAEYLDAAYLQQDAFHPVDSASSAERQQAMFKVINQVLIASMNFAGKEEARSFFQKLTQATKDWNRLAMDDEAFDAAAEAILNMVQGVEDHA